MKAFTEVKPEKFNESIFKLVGTDWMLIAAGKPGDFNMMTASWGGAGVLWHKPICWCVIRSSRYTSEFVEREEVFTLNFFDEAQRETLNFCGTHSGRDCDKAGETGLTPFAVGEGMAFEEARVVAVCRKIYFQDLDPANFLASYIGENYPEKDYHRMYIGEVVSLMRRP